MRRLEDETHPSQVNGFEQAKVIGVLPVVPETKPQPLPGLTALQRFALFIVLTLLGSCMLILLMQWLNILLPADAPYRTLMALPGILYFLAIIWGLHRVGDRAYQEFKVGYTTLKLAFGGFSVGQWRRWYKIDHRTPWDYRGLWTLDNKSEVIERPDYTILPPGFYPSPTHADKLELWSGIVWMGEFKDYKPSVH